MSRRLHASELATAGASAANQISSDHHDDGHVMMRKRRPEAAAGGPPQTRETKRITRITFTRNIYLAVNVAAHSGEERGGRSLQFTGRPAEGSSDSLRLPVSQQVQWNCSKATDWF